MATSTRDITGSIMNGVYGVIVCKGSLGICDLMKRTEEDLKR